MASFGMKQLDDKTKQQYENKLSNTVSIPKAQTANAGNLMTDNMKASYNAYQQNLSKPVEPEKWYKGSMPTTGEMYGRIATIGQQDRNAANGFMQQFQVMQSTPGNPYYNAYLKPTNPAVGNLQAMGVDVSNIDDDWFNQNSFLQEHYILGGTTNTPQKPGKNATPTQRAAYEYYQLSQQRGNTDSYLQENAALKQELAYQATRPDRNWTDEEIVNNINWDKYPTLKKMRQSQETGVPIELNIAAPGYTDDWCYGSIWAARNNGGTGDWQADIAMSSLGRGNVYQENPEMRAKLDATSDDYAPYSVGSTLEEEMLYFGVDHFDQKWLDDNRWMLNSNDETQKRMYQNVYNAELKTQELETQRTAMDNQIGELLKQSNDPDYILKRLKGNSDYSGLWAMDDSLGDAKLIDTTRAVDYRWKDVENEVRADCALNAMGQTAGGFAANLIGTLTGAVDPSVGTVTRTDEQKANDVEALAGNESPKKKTTEQALEEQQNANLSLASPGVIDYGTDAEKQVFTAGRSVAFDTLAKQISEVTPKPESVLPAMDEDLKGRIANNYMYNLSEVYRYEREGAELDAQMQKSDEITPKLEHLEERYIARNLATPENIEIGRELAGSDALPQIQTLMESDNPEDRIEGARLLNEYLGSPLLASDFIANPNVDWNYMITAEIAYPELFGPYMIATRGVPGEDYSIQTDQKYKDHNGEWKYDELAALSEDDIRNALGFVQDQKDIDKWTENKYRSHYATRANYAKALAGVKSDNAAYNFVSAVYDMNGKKYDSTMMEDIELLCAYDQDWEPTRWMPNTVYDMAVESGEAERSQIVGDARQTAVNDVQMEQKTRRALSMADDLGIKMTDEERRNVERKADAFRREGQGAAYFLLDDQPDFAEKANTARERGVTDGMGNQTKWIIRMMEGGSIYDNYDDETVFGKKLDKRLVATGAYSTEYQELERMFFGTSTMATTTPEEREARIATAFNAMTQAEKDRYYYLLETEGEDAANRYFAYLADETYGSLQVRASEEESRQIQEGIKRSGWNALGAYMFSFATNIMGGFKGWVTQKTDEALGQESAPHKIGYGATQFTSDARAATLDYIVDKIPGANREVVSFFFNALTSAVDSYLMSKLTSGFGELFGGAIPALEKMYNFMTLAEAGEYGGFVKFTAKAFDDWAHAIPMAQNAAMQAYRDAVGRGASPEQAKAMYNSTLFAESITEAITYGNIKDAFALGDTGTVSGFIGEIISNGFEESLGEGFNQWWEDNSERVIMGELSNYEAIKQQYIDAGYPDTIAEDMADREITKNILIAAASGFVSSGFSTTAGYMGGVIQHGGWSDPVKKVVTRDLAVLNRVASTEGSGPVNSTNAAMTISGVMRVGVDSMAANAASQKIVGDICEGNGQQAAQLMQGLVMAAGNQNVEVKQAIAFAALTNGQAHQELMNIAELVKQGENVSQQTEQQTEQQAEQQTEGNENNENAEEKKGPEFLGQYAANLMYAMEADLNGANAEALQAQYEGAVKEHRIAEKVRDAMATGAAAEKMAKLAANVSQKQDNLERAQGELSDLEGEKQAAADNVQAAAENQRNTPTPESNADLEQSLNELAGKDEQVRQKEGEVENAQQALQEAKAEQKRQTEQELTERRVEAAQAVEQEDQQAAVEARQNQQSESVNEANQEADTAEAELGNVMPAQQEQTTGEQAEEQTEQAPQSEAEQRLNAAREQLTAARQELEAAQQANDGSEEAMDRVDRAADEVKRIAKEIRENELTGQAVQRQNEAQVDAWLDSNNIQGEVREDLRKKMIDRMNAVADGSIDTTQQLNNVEGMLAVAAFGRKLGLNIKTSDTLGNARAMYDGDGTVYMNEKLIQNGNLTVGQALVEACLHEITHSMQGTKSYGNYSNLVMQILFRGDTQAENDAIAQKIAQYRESGHALEGQTDAEITERARQEIVADFARTNLNNRDVVARFLDNGLAGKMRNTLHNINQMLKNYKLEGDARTEAEYFRKAERLFQKMLDQAAKEAVHPDVEQFSIPQFAQAAGLTFNETEQVMYDQNGEVIDGITEGHKVTQKMMENTPIAMLVKTGMRAGNITQEEYNTIMDQFTQLMNLCARYRQSNMIWEIAASTLESEFSAIKSNSDKQYSFTVDFGTICTKTQAIVDQLSRNMLAAGRGLTVKEILDVYNDVYESDLTVPCPVCYVFSRWMGVPSLLGAMKDYQDRFLGKQGEEVSAEETQRRVDEYVKNAQEQYGIDEKFGERVAKQRESVQKKIDDQNLKINDLIAALDEKTKALEAKRLTGKSTTKAESAVNTAQKKVNEANAKLYELQVQYDNIEVNTYGKAINKVKSGLDSEVKKVLDQIDGGDTGKGLRDAIQEAKRAGQDTTEMDEKLTKLVAQYDALNKKRLEVDGYNWVTQALCYLDDSGRFVIDPEFKRTKDEVLFDLGRTAEFAKDVKNWKYRTTRGAGMGKAILPYSGAAVGDSVYGVKRRFASENAFLRSNPSEAEMDSAMAAAIEKAKRQNLIGGQRFQSTSDYRPEWGLDYIMTFIEQQAIGSYGQLYTKVAEAVPMYAKVGVDTNLSVMPFGDGYHIDENGNVVLDFSDVTGMNYDQAVDLKNLYDNVQLILVGINDTHITAALKHKDIDFVIPWHSSGNSRGQLTKMMASVDEQLNESSDYTKLQSDIKYEGEAALVESARAKLDNNEELTKEEAAALKREQARNVREKIITGGFIHPNDGKGSRKRAPTAQEMQIIRGSEFLSSLYHRFYEDKDSDCYGVKLTSSQASQIFPYEYWQMDVNQKGGTKETANENGIRFCKYCSELGYIPRFSGRDAKVTQADGSTKTEKYGNFSGMQYDENGKPVLDENGNYIFKPIDGYWKLLIDRSMYDNNGNYRSQQKINVTGLDIGHLEMGENGKYDLKGTDIAQKTTSKYNLENKKVIEAHRRASQKFDERMGIETVAYKNDYGFSVGGEFTDADIDQMIGEALTMDDIDNALGEMSVDEWLDLLGRGSSNENVSEEEVRKVMTNAVQDLKDEFDPTIYNGRLYVRPDTLDYWLSGGGFASSNPNYAQAYITSMNPADFLRMTAVTEEGQQRILDEATPLNEERLEENAKRQPIQLNIDEATGKIVGHEGRHRAVALARAGVTDMPVLLFDTATKYSKTPQRTMTLEGQDYNGNINGNTLTFTDVIPLSSGNADQIRERFTASEAEQRNAAENNQRILQYSTGGELTDADVDQMLAEAGVKTGQTTDITPPTNLPQQSVGETGNAYRQFGRYTAQESDALHEDVKNYLYNHSMYNRDTNAEQIDRAIGWVRSHASGSDPTGFYSAMQEALNEDFNAISADGQAQMLTLMSMAALDGKHNAETDLAMAFNEQGTKAGQTLQARKIFRMMTPLGRQSILLKMQQKINDEYQQEGNGTRVNLNPLILQAAAEATTEKEFDAVRKAANEDLARQMPADWKGRLRTWRMMSMLLNPRTHFRNIVGNALFVPTVGLKNIIGTGLERVFVKESERTKSIRHNAEATAFAENDFNEVQAILTGEAKYGPDRQIDMNRKYFGQKNTFLSRTLGRAVQGAADFNSALLENEDAWFLHGHYVRALSGWMTANNVTEADFNNDPAMLERARQYAINEAQKATYRDANWLAEKLSKAGQMDNFGGFLVNATIPFKKTPANILRRGIEYSPLGLAQSIATLRRSTKKYAIWEQNGFKGPKPKGARTLTENLDRIAAGMTGTMIAAVGAFFARMGWVTLKLGDDPEDRAKTERGYQDYSLNVFGHSFTIDWAAPVCMPLFLGASVYEAFSEEGEPDFGKLLDGLVGISEPIFNLSMLDGVSGLLRTSSYSGLDTTLPEIFLNIMKNYATSYIPAISGATARTIDPTRRRTYTESGTGMVWGKVNSAIEQTQNKIPFLSMENTPYRNAFGEEDTSPRWFAFLENFILPGYVNKIKDDEVIDEMERIYQQTGEDVLPKSVAGTKTLKVNGENVILTDKQNDAYQAAYGSTAKNTLADMIKRPEFMGLTVANPDAQVALVNDVTTYAKSVARHEVFPDAPMDTWIKNAYESGDPAGYIINRREEAAKSDAIKTHKAATSQAIIEGNFENAATSVAMLKEAGVDDKTIRDSIMKKVGPVYKQAYLDGDDDTMKYIESTMLQLDLGDSRFDNSTFKKWKDAARESD